MINDADNSEIQAEWDLLNDLFLNDLPSSWNPYTVKAEACFLDQNAEDSLMAAFTEAELVERSQRFMNQINQFWPATRLKTSLLRNFAEQIPDELLNRLAQAATRMNEEVSSRSLSLADQLVQCVQELLPQWSEEDLQVLARPFAYAMRGAELDGDGVRSNSTILKETSWSELSEIEQARTCFVITRYALLEVFSAQETS
ncbi:hypothetical protein [Planktothrix agardhii]|uniref:hypothetical protein n=1 Tax=Planktothrix agardhii TaxID=1160 RepID=UPI000409A154|nr:hypothetical protein [Planktothrix agardhii]